MTTRVIARVFGRFLSSRCVFFNFKHALVVRVLCSCQFQSVSRFVFICVHSVKFFQCALAIAIRFVRGMLYACCARAVRVSELIEKILKFSRMIKSDLKPGGPITLSTNPLSNYIEHASFAHLKFQLRLAPFILVCFIFWRSRSRLGLSAPFYPISYPAAAHRQPSTVIHFHILCDASIDDLLPCRRRPPSTLPPPPLSSTTLAGTAIFALPLFSVHVN